MIIILKIATTVMLNTPLDHGVKIREVGSNLRKEKETKGMCSKV